VTADGLPRYLIGDAKGAVLFDPAKTATSLRRWNGTPDGPIPAGAATGPVFAGGKVTVATVDRKAVVALDPSRDGPAWVLPEIPEAGEVIGLSGAGKRLLVTYLSGLVREVDPDTGEVTAETRRDPAAGTARVGAVRVSDTEVLMPSAGGVIGILPLVPR
jgi:outer membrane protein assembly factor BamB